MLTRGIVIGKIVDDLANLKYQIETRNRLGQFDLTKFCEDFFKEIFNTTYSLNLTNLNSSRSNFPGLDLGDGRNETAYQITSQKTSAKVNETLQAIKPEQATAFKNIFVFIIGEKQTSYTLEDELCEKYNFKKEINIKDIDDLLRDVVLLEMEKLGILYTLFQQEFRQVKIELEPLDDNGNFESSYFNVLEKKPSSPPKNGAKYLGDAKGKVDEKSKKKLIALYERLASVPRVTREILAIIVEKGKYGPARDISNKYGIIPAALEKFMRITQNELLIEVNILENAGLMAPEEGQIGERSTHFLVIEGTMLNELFLWMVEEKQSIRTLLNTMDFSILDN